MLTINAEIKKNEQRSDKTYNVKLRFTLNRKIKRLSTTIFVTPSVLLKICSFCSLFGCLYCCFYLYFLCLLFIFSYIVDYYIYKALKEQKKE